MTLEKHLVSPPDALARSDNASVRCVVARASSIGLTSLRGICNAGTGSWTGKQSSLAPAPRARSSSFLFRALPIQEDVGLRDLVTTGGAGRAYFSRSACVLTTCGTFLFLFSHWAWGSCAPVRYEEVHFELDDVTGPSSRTVGALKLLRSEGNHRQGCRGGVAAALACVGDLSSI